MKLAMKKFYPENIAKKTLKNLSDIKDLVDDIPEDTLKLIEKINNDKLALNFKISELNEITTVIKSSINKLVLAILTLTFGVGASILAKSNVKPIVFEMPLLAWIGYTLSFLTALAILNYIIKKK